jgi:hypothetical protein
MADQFRAQCAELADTVDTLLRESRSNLRPGLPEDCEERVSRARTLLAQTELPHGYIDPGHSDADRELLEAFYLAARSEGGTADEIHLRGIQAAIALALSRAPVQPADGEVAELVADLQRFIIEYGKMRGLHPELIYSIQEGIEGQESHLTISQLTRTAALLQHGQSALHRLHRLQQENAQFREPERTILCDLLANGTLLPDPDGKRYGGQPVDGEVADEELDRLERRHCDLSIYTHFMDGRAVPYPGVTYVG